MKNSSGFEIIESHNATKPEIRRHLMAYLAGQLVEEMTGKAGKQDA